jgi:hypothetical protein
MPDTTLEKIHLLLEKLADYVMNEVSTKMKFRELKDKVDTIIDVLDKHAHQLEIIRIGKCLSIMYS